MKFLFSTVFLSGYFIFGFGEIFLNLDWAISDVIRADPTMLNVAIFYDESFESTVMSLQNRLYKFNCRIMLFQMEFISISGKGHFKHHEIIIGHLKGFSIRFDNLITVNLLKRNSSIEWLNILTQLPILKRPNKHIFVYDYEDSRNNIFHQWQDEMVAVIFFTSINQTSNVINYYNMPCDIDNPTAMDTKCRLTWLPDKYLINYPTPVGHRLSSLELPTYTIGIVKNPFKFGSTDNIACDLEGFERKIMDYLATSLHFKLKYLVINSTSWGRLTSEGTWDGLVGAVLNGEVQMVICQLTMTAARLEVVDFSRPYIVEPMIIVSKADPVTWNNAFMVIKTFDPILWIIIVITIAMFGLLFTIMMRVSLVDNDSIKTTPLAMEVLKQNANSFLTCIFYIYRTSAGTATWETTRWNSIRICVFTMIMFGFIMNVIYNARLTMMTTYLEPENGIDDLHDLLREVKRGEPLILRRNSFVSTVFESHYATNSPSIYHDIYETSKSSGGLKYINEESEYMSVLPSIKDNGGIVVHEQSGIFTYLGSINDSYKFHVSAQPFAYNLYSIAMRKGFRWKKDIDKLILMLESGGILNRWYKVSLCVDKLEELRQAVVPTDSSGIQMGDFVGGIYVISVGMLGAVFIFICEIIYKFCEKQCCKN